MRTDVEGAAGYLREGFSFSSMYTTGIRQSIKGTVEVRTWLKVEKAN